MSEASKDVVSAFERGTIVVKQGGSLAEVRDALSDVAEIEAPDAVPFPPVPAPVVLTDDVKKALKRLPEVFAGVQPLERRELTSAEMEAVYAERDVLKKVVDLISGRDESLKEIIRHHMDVVAESEGRANPEDTLRDANGHYVLSSKGKPERANIPGTNQAWSREYRAGTTTNDATVLDDLLESGEISREAYLAMTEERRVFNENRTMLALSQKPDLRADIFKAIKKMTRHGRAGTSLFTRKAQ